MVCSFCVPKFILNKLNYKEHPSKQILSLSVDILKIKIMKAIWNNQVLAESNDTIVIENNHYFPATSIKEEFFQASGKHTICPWKGEASYYTLVVDGQKNEDAAWY